MKIALFGGTFDPIHCGHIAAAQAARDMLGLDRVYFVPSGRPPHRTRERLTAFEHRYAMVALACAGEEGFIPSLAEAPSRPGVHYSIRTVRRFGRQLAPGDSLFFLIGADAFLDFRSWFQWRALLRSASFIIVSRSGIAPREVERVFPNDEVLEKRRLAGAPRASRLRLRRGAAWMLADVMLPISATEIRRCARQGRDLQGMVPAAVAEYIRKQRLYQ
jgi:nicotinate-nucleotide adenylyltransferase